MLPLPVLILMILLIIIFPTDKFKSNKHLLGKYSVKISKVVDGDTLVADLGDESVRIRLYGIDAPELGQNYGKRASEVVKQAVKNKKVDLEVFYLDPYDRLVARVNFGANMDLAEYLLTNGFAWLYPRYCDKSFCQDWALLEQKAKSAKRGLWSQPKPEAPWLYRQDKKNKEQD